MRGDLRPLALIRVRTHSEGMFRRRHHIEDELNRAREWVILSAGSCSCEESLDESLDRLMAFTSEQLVPASAVINPLLIAWDAAHEVAQEAAVPIEALLTTSVQRVLLDANEIVECVEEVRSIALQMAILAQLAAS